MFGIPLGLLGMATMGDGRSDFSPDDLVALQNAYAEARKQGRISRGWEQFGPGPNAAIPYVPKPQPDASAAAPAQAPAQPSASGPDVIQKLMSYFHQKDNPSD